MPDLLIFDVDGTLAERYSVELLPHVKGFFDLIFQGNCPQRPKVAIASNQGGVGMRYWMEKRFFGKPEKYPSQQEVELRMEKLVSLLGGDSSLPIYISYRYQTKQGKWAPAPRENAGDPRWQETWRKPQPGMLLQAMRDAGVTPEQTLFIGDRPEDQQAAEAAGCSFQWATDFFAHPWTDCSQIMDLLHEF